MERFKNNEELQQWTDMLFEMSDKEVIRILFKYIEMIRERNES